MKVMVLAILLFASLAQIVPSCAGESRTVIGIVEAKYTQDGLTYLTVDSIDYRVPANFWIRVEVGDWVKWDGIEWTIFRRRVS